MKITVIQGPNLNMLGHRDPKIYGSVKLDQIHANLTTIAKDNNCDIDFFQSNLTGEIIDRIQECIGTSDGILINPAGYSHTCIALADAIALVGIPVVEVHISNIFGRDEYRRVSLTGAASTGVITGFGPFGYHLGLFALIQIINELKQTKQAQNNR